MLPEFEVDERHDDPNDTGRREREFRQGWKAALDREPYKPETPRRLTWHNLGYRLGRLYGPDQRRADRPSVRLGCPAAAGGKRVSAFEWHRRAERARPLCQCVGSHRGSGRYLHLLIRQASPPALPERYRTSSLLRYCVNLFPSSAEGRKDCPMPRWAPVTRDASPCSIYRQINVLFMKLARAIPGRYIRTNFEGWIGAAAADYHHAMFDPADAADPDVVYSNCLRTCAMLGIKPVPRERALGLILEWAEVLPGRREPTQH